MKVFNAYTKYFELMTFEDKETIMCPIGDTLFTTEVAFLLKKVCEGMWARDGMRNDPYPTSVRLVWHLEHAFFT